MVVNITVLIISIFIINVSFIIIIIIIVVNTSPLLSMIVYCSKNRRLHFAHHAPYLRICLEYFVFMSRVLQLYA